MMDIFNKELSTEKEKSYTKTHKNTKVSFKKETWVAKAATYGTMAQSTKECSKMGKNTVMVDTNLHKEQYFKVFGRTVEETDKESL